MRHLTSAEPSVRILPSKVLFSGLSAYKNIVPIIMMGTIIMCQFMREPSLKAHFTSVRPDSSAILRNSAMFSRLRLTMR